MEHRSFFVPLIDKELNEPSTNAGIDRLEVIRNVWAGELGFFWGEDLGAN